MKVRRHRHLVCRWTEQGLLVGVPDQPRWVRVTGGVRTLLDATGGWADVDELVARLGDPDGAHAAVDGLRGLGLLIDDTTGDTGPDEPAGPWLHWGDVVRRGHVEARDADYLVDSPRRDTTVADIVADGPGPAPYKDYPDAPVLPLPRRPLPLRTAVEDVFAARRTHRTFTGEAVDVDQLATVLFWTFSPQRFIDGGAFGAQQGRASASAGGRHEAECYVVVFDVTGVPPGLYHYSPRLHALELLRADVDRAELAALTYHQEPSYEAAFTCLTTAVADRLAWKYRHPRAYRLWMYDAGHYGQTFALACTALGLGPFQTVAFADTQLERFLGVDGDHEFAVYLLSAGVPAPGGPAGLPADFPHPSPAAPR